ATSRCSGAPLRRVTAQSGRLGATRGRPAPRSSLAALTTCPMLFNPSRPRTRAKRLSSTNLILIGGEILRGLSFCLVMILLASAIALTGTPSGVGASSNRLSPAASLDRIAPTTVYPFLPNVKVTDESSPYKYQVEPTMVINRSGTVFAGWKDADGPDAGGFRVGSSYSTDRGQTWAPNILMNQP